LLALISFTFKGFWSQSISGPIFKIFDLFFQFLKVRYHGNDFFAKFWGTSFDNRHTNVLKQIGMSQFPLKIFIGNI